MKLLKSVILAAVTADSGVAVVSTAAETALTAGCDRQGVKPNAYQGGCVSDVFCNELDGYQIFNHFHFPADQALELVPECRAIVADLTAGFTCGTDTRLATGTEVVIPNVPTTGYDFDTRAVKLLKKGKYQLLETALDSHKLCEDEPEHYTCDNIDHFEDGCISAVQSVNGLTRFTDFFSVADCEPEVIEHHEDNGWIEEYKVFIGYDDLSILIPGGERVTLDVHKVYEISCKIEKMGEVATEFDVKKEQDNGKAEDSLKTNFFIEKYFGDVTDISTRKLITNTIPLGPDANPNEKVQFKISSDHPDEYVHLEECELMREDDNGNIVYQQVFMRDGCVEADWKPFIDNSPSRTDPTINEDWFNMRPLVTGCKTKWHIKCKTASCKRGLETENEQAFNAYCSMSDTCPNRSYLASFLNPPLTNVHTGSRRRRSAGDNAEDIIEEAIEEAIVEAVLEHPCKIVDNENPKNCLDGVCWTLAQCAAAYPDDYQDYDPESDEDAQLDEIIEKIRDLFEEHIEEIKDATEEEDDEADFMREIAKQAQSVLAATHTIEDVVEKLIQSIAARNS